jgi:hypothetical protein
MLNRMTDWPSYLYRRHSKGELARWARELEFFRFCRAFGGHMNDADHFLVSLQLDEEVGKLGTGQVAIAGQPVYAQERLGRLEIILYGDEIPYEVTEAAVQSAKLIEPVLRPLAVRIIDPPMDNERCVCPKYYPEIWV